MLPRATVKDIRNEFVRKAYINELISGTIEIVGANFIADEPTIFGEVNEDYVNRELEWYRSQSLNVYDIPGGPPTIWKQVADKDGWINSNYGWCIWSKDNLLQYDNVLNELRLNSNSRRAIMIYTRPSMWEEYNKQGMSDFICTNAVQYLIRESDQVKKLDVVVQMRSNDVWAGYRNDLAWQKYVQNLLCLELGIKPGIIYWNAGSLHLYEKDWYLLDWYKKTGEINISKKEYKRLFPDSIYAK